MKSDPVLQAILLLCSYFTKDQKGEVKPLTPTEYSRLAMWLHRREQTPADLLLRDKWLVEQWNDPKGAKGTISQDRLTGLLRRSASMGFALEKWQQQNLWVLSRADHKYPKVLKDKLGDTRSPLLYCIGNEALLSSPSIGFVGSRNIDQADTDFTEVMAQQAVKQGYVVVSGGAKGVDQTSMTAALDAGGSAIGVLADSLLRAATKSQYRTALQEGRLLLLTPYYPEAGFSTGSAMGRNKYIYLLSEGVVVARSDEKGGTWAGATEDLKKQWVPLWVRDLNNAGNKKLIELGGQPLTSNYVDYNVLLSDFSLPPTLTKRVKQSATNDLFAESEVQCKVTGESVANETEMGGIAYADTKVVDTTSGVNETGTSSGFFVKQSDSVGVFLDLFYHQLRQEDEVVHTPSNLLDKYPELQKKLITDWLTTLAEKGLLKREGRKHEYTVVKKVDVM